MEQDIGDFGFVRMVDEIGGAGAFPGHAHVERPVALEGEAALGLVELHRGDADVEGDAVDPVDAVRGKRLTHPGESFRNKRQALPARGSQRLSCLDRFGIAIEGDDAGRSLIQDGLGVAARAERAVHMRLAGGDGERMDDLFGEDGNMGRDGGGGGHDATPLSSSASAANSRISASPLFSASCGFQSSNVAPTPTNKASSSSWPRRRSLEVSMMRPLVS